MDQFKKCEGVNYNLFNGKWIDAPAQAKEDPTNIHAIDPNMKYPAEFREFMALDGDWDLNGVHSRAYDDYNMLTFDEVCEIYKRRQKI